MHLTLTAACALTISAGAALSMATSSSAGDHKEFGAVQWGRKLEPALESAAASKKPVMLMFQEVPG